MPRFLLPSLLPLAIASLSPTTSAEPQAPGASPAKLALVDGINFSTAGIPKSVHERERFLDALRRGLAAKGWPTIETVSDDACTGVPDCLPAVARLAHADHALRLTGDGNLKYGYTIRLDLYSVATGQTQQTTAFCDICNTDRIAGIAADFAAKLLVSAQAETAGKAAAPQPTTRAKPSLQPAAEPPRPLLAASTVSDSPRRLRWIPWTMTAVGVVAMAYGGWALAKDGDATGSPSSPSPSPSTYVHDTYSSRALGLSSLIGGGLLAGAGVIWIVSTPSKTTAVTASPSRVALTVRF